MGNLGDTVEHTLRNHTYIVDIYFLPADIHKYTHTLIHSHIYSHNIYSTTEAYIVPHCTTLQQDSQSKILRQMSSQSKFPVKFPVKCLSARLYLATASFAW